MIGQRELDKRIANMTRLGILRPGPTPTPWQIEQAGWIIQPAITTFRPGNEPDFDTWLARSPQRLLVQLFTGSGSRDGTGFDRDTQGQIWHILTIHHIDIHGFGYDLEMLAGHDNGLERMLSEVKAMLSGAHPRAWLARQLIGTGEYWPRVQAATQQFLAGDFTFEGSHVQESVDLALSLPATREETLRHPKALARMVAVIPGLVENGLDMLGYTLRLKPLDEFHPPGPAAMPKPLS